LQRTRRAAAFHGGPHLGSFIVGPGVQESVAGILEAEATDQIVVMEEGVGELGGCVAEPAESAAAPADGTVAVPIPMSKTDKDAALVEALRRESPEAVETLVHEYGDRVYRLAMRITGEPADAEEAAQDALWTAARKIHLFKGEAAFGSWLYRIAANAAYHKLRTRKGRRQEIAWDAQLPGLDANGRHFRPMEDWSARVDDIALQGELRAVLTGAIDRLPPDYRTALVMHDVEGLPNPEIAETLGISLPAVKSRVHRSRLFLRQQLAEYLEPGR
jgi:RNA polymerase sigma-70 factor, ECF subfamily